MAATTSFRLGKYATTTTEPAQPAVTAWPTTVASPIVRYPMATRQDGYGHPAGIVGRPYCEFGRERITATGLSFYTGMFASSADEYVQVKAKLYDARTQTWLIYKGILWRPTIRESAPGVYVFREFRAVITELEVLATWASS